MEKSNNDNNANGAVVDIYQPQKEPLVDVPMDDAKALEILRDIFAGNRFTQYVGAVIDEVSYGRAKLHLKIVAENHANLSNHVHGGVFYTLANTAAGVAAMSTGRYVVTQSMTCDFIRNIKPGDVATCVSRATHVGRRTVSLVSEVTDGEGRLLVSALTVMFVTGFSHVLPIKW